MKRYKRGFTLLELLVVLAVMGVMMGLIGFSLLGGGGNELGAAQRELLGLVQKARSQAALSGRETRLLVCNDPEDEQKFHRYVEIVSQDSNDSSIWSVVSEGSYLTDRVYFVPSDETLSLLAEEWRRDAFCVWSHDDYTDYHLSAPFKGERKAEGDEKFVYLAFNAEGNLICTKDEAGIPLSPKLVISIGEPYPADEEKALRFNDSSSIAGILLRRFGGVAILDVNDFVKE